MFTETQQPTMLHELAQYSWTVPEYRDWGDVLDQAAAQCQPEPDRMPWRRLCDVPDQFLGGVENCSHPASAGVAASCQHLPCQSNNSATLLESGLLRVKDAMWLTECLLQLNLSER